MYHLRHATADRHGRWTMTSWTRAWVCAFLCVSVSNYAAAEEVQSYRLCKNDCQPVPALGETIHIDFRNRSLGDYIAQVAGPLDFDTGHPMNNGDGKGLVLLLTGENDSPQIRLPRHIFFGRVDVELTTAPGPGTVTSLNLVSPDGNEIIFDWTGANDKTVQTNFFSRGNTVGMKERILYHPIDGSSSNFHTYSLSWGTRWVQWMVNDNVIRQIDYHKEDDGTPNMFPQTPMSLTLGCWVAGRHTSAGTLEWAGGPANFSDGPKRAYIKTLNITDDAFNTGIGGQRPKFYTWRDGTGVYSSIGFTSDDPPRLDFGTKSNSTGTNSTGTNSTITNLESLSSPNRLGTGGIAGIVVGFVAAIAMIGALAAVVLAQRRKRAKQDKDDARDLKLGNMSVEEVGGVDNKPELDGCVLVELSSHKDKEAQELNGEGDVRLEMGEDNNPQELSPVGSDECEDVYYEKLRSMGELKSPRDEEEDGKPGTGNGSNV